MSLNLFTALKNVMNPRPGLVPGTLDYGITELFGGGSNPYNSITANNPAMSNPNTMNYIGPEGPPPTQDQLNQINGIQTTSPTSSGGLTTYQAPTQQQPSGGLDAPTFLAPNMDAVNSAYDANIAHLNDQYNQLVAAQPGNETYLTNQYNTSVQSLNNQRDNAFGQTDAQTRTVQKNQQSAIAQSRNLYNQLSQQGIARFGAGSSTGPAYSEIVSRATAQNIGQAQSQAAESLDKIYAAKNQISQTYMLSSQEINNNYTKGMEDLKRQFQNDVSNINYQRSMTDIQKAQANAEALTTYKTQLYNWATAKQAYEDQLKLYTLQQNTALDGQTATILKSMLPEGTINSFIKQINQGNVDTATQFKQPVKSTSTSYVDPMANMQGYLELTTDKTKDPLYPYVNA